MEKFIGYLEPGESFGSSTVVLNTRLRRMARDYVATNGGTITGYLHGKYRRGWLVLIPAAIEPETTP